MKENPMKFSVLVWFAGFFAFPAFLHIIRMSFQLDLAVGGLEIPMKWSTVVIGLSIIISAAFLLAAAQKCTQEEEEVVEPEKPPSAGKKPVINRPYGSENFEGEDSISSGD